jgi:hypothetical protein
MLGEPVTWLDGSSLVRTADRKPARVGRYHVTNSDGTTHLREWDGRKWGRRVTFAMELLEGAKRLPGLVVMYLLVQFAWRNRERILLAGSSALGWIVTIALILGVVAVVSAVAGWAFRLGWQRASRKEPNSF